MHKKALALFMTAVMAVGLFAGCSGENTGDGSTEAGMEKNTAEAGTSGEETEIKTLNYGIPSSPSGIFLYQFHNDTYNSYVTTNVFDSLVVIDPTGVAEAKLAKEWKVSEDEKTYTFTLNENVTWHDGEPFTANDVAFTLNFMASPDYTGFYSSYVSTIEGYEEVQAGTADTLSGVSVNGDYEISITTSEIYASMLTRIGVIGIMAEHIWKDVDIATADQQTELLRNPVGTGPYKLKEFVQDQYVTLEANPGYYGGVPKIDEVSFVTVNGETVQAQLLNGEIDVFPLTSINEDDLKIYEDAGLNVEFYTNNGWQSLQINCQNELLSKREVRQALAYAIDRKGMVDSLLYGYGKVANAIYASTFWTYPGDENLPIYEYKPKKAIELFESVGLTYDSENNQMLDEEGNQLTLRLFVPTGNKVRENAGVVIQSNLTDIGIKCEMETMEFATLFDLLGQTDDPANFDLALIGYSMGADPDVSELVSTNGGTNFCRYYNDEIDSLLEAAQLTTDQSERKELYGKVAAMLAEESPAVYLFNQDGAYAMGAGVEMQTNPFSGCYHIEQWDITK